MMQIDNLPQEPITTQPVNSTWRTWFSNLSYKMKTIPEDVLSLKVTNDISSENISKCNKKFILDQSTKKLYLVFDGVKHEIKLAEV